MALTRREFLKLVGLFPPLALGISGCLRTPEGPPPFPRVDPETPVTREDMERWGTYGTLLWTLTGLRPDASVRNLTYLKDPAQTNLLIQIINQNQLARATLDAWRRVAIDEGRAVGLAGISTCSDSRVCLRPSPAIVDAEGSLIYLQDAQQIGAQPAIFPQGTVQSVFMPHESLCEGGAGCGFLDGVKMMIREGTEAGSQALRHHNVPEETIVYVEKWIQMYADEFQHTDSITVDEWAKVGGRIQAYINAQKQNLPHQVLFGVRAHGTNEFRALGIVDNSGNIREVQSNPILEAIADYLHQPHNVVDTLIQGQQPNFNLLNVSQRTPNELFGPTLASANEGFILAHDARAITAQTIDELISGLGYSIGALEQRGNIIFITADNAVDMAAARQALLGSSYAQEFINKGGLIVELMPGKNGLFIENPMVLRSFENPGAAFGITKAQIALAETGGYRYVNVLRVEQAGDQLRLRIKSAMSGKTYEVLVPQGAHIGALSAERLEAIGIPVAEALWYERALSKMGKVLGKTFTVGANIAFFLLSARQASELIAQEIGWGKITAFETYEEAPMSGELLQALLDNGLENSPARYIVSRDIDSIRKMIEQAIAWRGLFDKTPEELALELTWHIEIDDNRSVLGEILLTEQDVATPLTVRVSAYDTHMQNEETVVRVTELTFSAPGDNGEQQHMVVTYDPKTQTYKVKDPHAASIKFRALSPAVLDRGGLAAWTGSDRTVFSLPYQLIFDPDTGKLKIVTTLQGILYPDGAH